MWHGKLKKTIKSQRSETYFLNFHFVQLLLHAFFSTAMIQHSHKSQPYYFIWRVLLIKLSLLSSLSHNFNFQISPIRTHNVEALFSDLANCQISSTVLVHHFPLPPICNSKQEQRKLLAILHVSPILNIYTCIYISSYFIKPKFVNYLNTVNH